MAAAAFEALFHGDDDYNFDADPGAVVIWFSDDAWLTYLRTILRNNLAVIAGNVADMAPVDFVGGEVEVVSAEGLQAHQHRIKLGFAGGKVLQRGIGCWCMVLHGGLLC